MLSIEQLNKDIKEAMKAKNKAKLAAIRAIKAEILVLNTSGKEVKEEDKIKMLQKMIKQRKDTASLYKEQGREDLYEKEIQDVPFIEEYLPEQMSQEELTQIIQQIVSETGASSMKDMGKVMGTANKKLAGKAEGKLIADTVKKILNR